MEPHPTPARPRRQLLETGLVTLLMTAAAGFVLRPLPFHLDHWTGPGLGDPLFLLVVLKWNLHQFRLGVPDLLDIPFFHPTEDVLALSDHFLGPSLALWPVAAVVGPIAAFNLLLWAAYALTGASAFWLFRRIGLGRAAALFGALAFTFSPWRVDQSPHLQMLLIATVPPMLWCWDRLLRPDGRGRHAVGFVLCYGIQVWSSSYLGFMIHVPLGVLALLRALSPEGGWRDWLRPGKRLRLLLTLAAAGTLLIAAYSPYLIQDSGLELRRGDESIRALGATGLSLVTPSNFAWYWRAAEPVLTPLAEDDGPGWFAEKALFAGFLPTLLAVAGLVALVRRTYRPSSFAGGLLIASAVCLSLAFPLFYGPAAELLPGFSRLRVPARFYTLASLGITFLAARTLDGFLRRLRSPVARRGLAAVAVVLLAVELTPLPLPFEEIPREAELPEVDRWIGAQDDLAAYVELPFRRPPSQELVPMYHATLHWKPLVNGFSGYVPTDYARLRDRCCELPPTDDDLAELRRFGVTHVLVRTPPPGRRARPRYREWRRKAWAGELPVAREVFSGSNGEAVYELLPP